MPSEPLPQESEIVSEIDRVEREYESALLEIQGANADLDDVKEAAEALAKIADEVNNAYAK